LICSVHAISADTSQTLDLEFDTLNRRLTDSGSIWYGYGNIRLRLDSTSITSDSVIWYREYDAIHFYGDVHAYDSVQHIRSGQLSYYHRDSLMVARDNVIAVHERDSIRTESQTARYDRKSDIIYLEDNPRLFLNYPDTANMIEIEAEYMTFFHADDQAEAQDNVVITYQETRATSGCAEFFRDENLLILTQEPHAERDSSEITGRVMRIRFAESGIDRIEVSDSASAFFVEKGDSTEGTFSGESILSGNDITFYFRDDQIRRITAAGEARSEYRPSADDTTGAGKNFVSGDSIFIFVDDRRISKAEIKGGAEGIYITEAEETDSVAVDAPAEQAADSLRSTPDAAGISDSLPTDSTFASVVDGAATTDSLESGTPEDSIHYRGRFLEYFAENRIIRVSGDAHVRQGQVELEADTIDYDVPQRVVLAQARVDVVEAVESGAVDTIVTPLALKDGSEQIFGSKLVFNVDTKQGLIEDATTQYEQAYYRGRDLFKEEEKVFYVENGRLTSCELEEPHFHFRSERMKLIHNDRVIARPVVFYVETLPVAIIPYYVFPLKRGRHSGILPIRLGNFEQGNRFIGNLGYYWAASEYWDIETSMDYYENAGMNFNTSVRYNKRYGFRGSVSGSYARNRQERAFGESRSDDWWIRGDHRQTLPYDVDFGANWQFVSGSNYTNLYVTDPQVRRNRSIISKANFKKQFGRASMSLSFEHTDNIDSKSRNSNLPRGALTLPSFHPFGSGREVDGVTVKNWYNQFYVSYRNSFAVFTSRDSLPGGGKTGRDYAYLDHHSSMTAPQKLFTYVTFSPRLSLSETWYYIMDTDQAHKAGIPANRPYRRGAISAGVGSNTDLYGTFPINVLGLMALRHVMSPSVSFNWAPAITKNDAVKSFARVGSGGGQQLSLGFGLRHLFQAKVKSGEEEKKLDLLSISSGSSYNFKGGERKFGNLSTTISSSLIRNVNLQGRLTHTLYDENDDLIWKSPSLRSFSISASFQARGSVADDYVRQSVDPGFRQDTLGYEGTNGLDLDVSSQTSTMPGGASWNLNFTHNYSESRQYGTTTNRTHWLRFTFNVDITENWKIKYSQTYDFVRHESVDKMIDIFRKLHCWEGHFYWIPTGSRQGYYFKINVVSIPDIKVEKSESGLRGALFNR